MKNYKEQYLKYINKLDSLQDGGKKNTKKNTKKKNTKNKNTKNKKKNKKGGQKENETGYGNLTKNELETMKALSEFNPEAKNEEKIVEKHQKISRNIGRNLVETKNLDQEKVDLVNPIFPRDTENERYWKRDVGQAGSVDTDVFKTVIFDNEGQPTYRGMS
jgi:hypothetical protein